MALKETHIQNSIRDQRNNPLYRENSALVIQIISQVHTWMDFYVKQKGDNFDYSDGSVRHREQRHHAEGIREATEELAKIFGEKYKDLIDAEATSHVLTDMATIPMAADYKAPDFWEKQQRIIKSQIEALLKKQ